MPTSPRDRRNRFYISEYQRQRRKRRDDSRFRPRPTDTQLVARKGSPETMRFLARFWLLFPRGKSNPPEAEQANSTTSPLSRTKIPPTRKIPAKTSSLRVFSSVSHLDPRAGFPLQAIPGLIQAGNERDAAAFALGERDGGLDLRQHGAGGELPLPDIGARLIR